MTDYTARRTMMVDTQVRPSDVTSFSIIHAMLSVPREDFVPRSLREAAYMGENMDLGGNRVILEPRTFAKLLEELDIRNDDLVLDVGSALGYSAAVMAHMAQAVVALEADEAMSAEAQELLQEHGFDNVILHTGPLGDGAAVHGPYDAIIVQGAVQQLPAALPDQLKEGGRIICLFMEGTLGTARIGYKLNGQITWRSVFNAAAPVLPGFEKHVAFTL